MIRRISVNFVVHLRNKRQAKSFSKQLLLKNVSPVDVICVCVNWLKKDFPCIQTFMYLYMHYIIKIVDRNTWRGEI